MPYATLCKLPAIRGPIIIGPIGGAVRDELSIMASDGPSSGSESA